MKKQIVSLISLSIVLSSAALQGQQKRDSLKEKAIEEVVLVNVGYGTQKKSVVTGAIAKVSSKDLEKVPSGGVGTALQGRSSGVFVASNSGAPGSLSTVSVRGKTTFGDSGALWVVDGIVFEKSSLNAINQQDIESIEVLKDASAAIYGTRAAGGVILITTKKGKKGKLSASYNGFLGFSSPEKVLKVLNATEYATLLNERSTAGGGSVIFNDVSSLGKGTDWQKEVFNNSAMKYNHDISISGGNENSSFYMSFGLQDIEGIVATEISHFNKKSFRFNSNHKLFDKINVGQTFSYTHDKSGGIGGQNTEFGGVLSSAIMLDPTTPTVVTDPVLANSSPYNLQYVVRDPNGNPYGISSLVGQEIVNPLAFINTQRGNYGYGDNFIGNIFAEVELIKGLKFKSNIGGKLSYWGGQGFTPKFYLNASTSNLAKSSISRNDGHALDWTLTNTLTYSNKLGGHNFTILLGQEANKNGIGGVSYVTHSNLPTNNYLDASFNYDVSPADKTGSAFTYNGDNYTSLFARVTYDYNEKYLFTGVYRIDGSSRFGSDKKYGYFPSFTAGWVASKEDFWRENNIINTLKIRGGYGVTGHTGALDGFKYLSLVAGGNNYTLGNNLLIGYAPTSPANPSLHWEETAQGDIGFEAKLLNNFNVVFDYYNKKTSGILQRVRIPGYVGANGEPWANVADMLNKGYEVEANYKKKIGEVNVFIGGNFSQNKNEVTDLGNLAFITQDAQGFQSMSEITRSVVGQAYNSFYGFKTMGIFQNWADVNAYKNTGGTLIQPKAQPGDFRWQDTNGDGSITDDDKVFLGSPIPKYTFGFNISLDYKNFDFMMFAQGAAGNKIFQGLRRLDVDNANFQAEALSRWTGEGTSNNYPRLTITDTNGNFSKMSDFYLEKGDYLRLKLVQLGYSLPSSVAESIKASKVRLYVTAENLYTLTKYTGYDPEIGGTVGGVDKGFYPQARTFMFGLNVQF